MPKWIPAGSYGLRYREHQTRTTGVGRSKRPLRYYVAVYKWLGKTVTDSYGWEGDDFDDYDDIIQTAVQLKQNRRNRNPPFTLKELLQKRSDEYQATLDAKEEARKREEGKKATLLDNVFAEYCKSNAEKKSLSDEKTYYKNWIKPTLGSKRLEEIVLLDLERIKRKMAKAGKADRSVQYIKSIVRQVYRFAIKRKLYTGEIPTTFFLEKQKLNNKRERFLTREEATALLDKVREKSQPTYQICLLSLNSGLRFGEIANLQWQHIKLQNRTILVIDAKNGESRTAPINQAVLDMFHSIPEGKPYELVFPNSRGQKMTRVSNTFARAVHDLGLNDGITDRRMKVVFHSLRHTCASWLVNAGVGLPVIAKILGHKTLKMTQRYAHVNDDSVQAAIGLLDQQQQEASISRKVIPMTG